MPPEQADGRIDEIDQRSDIYSQGAVPYCLLTGRPSFQAASVMETLKQVLEREPVSPRQLNPSVNRDKLADALFEIATLSHTSGLPVEAATA